MANVTPGQRAALDALIQHLSDPRPDLHTDRGRLDYRDLLLAQNARALCDLQELNPDAAVFLYHLACERLRELLTMQLLSEARAKDLIGELVTLYGGYRPELLPRILTEAKHNTEGTLDA